MKNDAVKLFVLAMIALVLVISLGGCGSSQSAVNYHQGLQRELTYDNAVNNLETFTVKSAKEDNKSLRKEVRGQEKQNSENAKRKTIEDKNAELRAKLEEVKNNKP